MDPYSRVPRSPKSRGQQSRPLGLEGLSQPYEVQECKSPISDQVGVFNPALLTCLDSHSVIGHVGNERKCEKDCVTK